MQGPFSIHFGDNCCTARQLPDLDIFPQNARSGFSGEDVAEFVHSPKLGAAARRSARIAALVQDEMSHPAVESIADPDALLELSPIFGDGLIGQAATVVG